MSQKEKFTLSHPELEAEIYYLTPQDGGRNTAVASGYRGQFYYNGRNWDAAQEFLDKDICSPGETVKVYLQTSIPDCHVGQFFVGQEFETREGAVTVGKGKITKVLRSDFNYWDGLTFLKSLDNKIKPYTNSDDLLGFRMDIEYLLEATEILENIQIEMTGDLECMMLIKCKTSGKNRAWGVARKVVECWKTEIAFSNQLHKFQMETKFDRDEQKYHLSKFVLTFATWHSQFITGQIIVSQYGSPSIESKRPWWKFW